MSELIFMVEEAPEGGFTARALGEAIFTEADSMEDLRKQVTDAVQCHFEPGKAPRGGDLTQNVECEMMNGGTRRGRGGG
jgi:hypothetical protein